MYCSLQANPEQKILDNRPEQDDGIPLLALLYRGFGDFQDDMECAIHNPSLSNVNLHLKGHVDTLAKKMSEIGPETRQEDTMIEILQNALGISDHILEPFGPSESGTASGGYLLGKDGGPWATIEYKPSLEVAEP